jgi:hypothetical protein
VVRCTKDKYRNSPFKKDHRARHPWLTPVILVIQEAEIGKIMVRSQSEQIVDEPLSRKKPSQKWAGGVTQGVGPEFKPYYRKIKERS